MSMSPLRTFCLFWIFISAVSALGQWVNFSDETDAMLVLSTVPADDDEEKDMAVGDFNKDGWDDVIVVRKKPFSTVGPRADLLLINQEGKLVDLTTTFAPDFASNPTDSRDVLVMDLDGDSWPDLLIANTFQQQPSFYLNLGESNGLWLGFRLENGRLPMLRPLSQPSGPQFCAVWGGDLDGDGDSDLYLANYAVAGGTSDALLINNGAGFFSDETNARLGDFANVAFGTSAEIHDVDNDGDLDIVKISTLYGVQPWGDAGVFIIYNDGNGNFDNFAFTGIPGNSPYMFTVADLDLDNKLDFYIVSDFVDSIARIDNIQANGPISFNSQDVSSTRTNGFGGNVKFGDVDNDGFPDMGVGSVDVDIANCFSNGQFALLRNDGNGALLDPWPGNQPRNFHVEPHDFVFLDIDRDGMLDIFMGLCRGWSVFRQILRPPCPGDCFPDNGEGTFGDGVVDQSDMAMSVSFWAGLAPPCDFFPDNGDGSFGDGTLTIQDLLTVQKSLGPCPK